MPRRTIAGSDDKYVFSFIRVCRTPFWSGCTVLRSHRCVIHFLYLLISTWSYHGFSFEPLDRHVVTGHCDFLIMFPYWLRMVSLFPHFLFALCVLSGEMVVHAFCQFSNWSVYLLWILWDLFYILDVSPLSDMWLVNIFCLSIACLFILLTRSFMEQKFLILMRSN